MTHVKRNATVASSTSAGGLWLVGKLERSREGSWMKAGRAVSAREIPMSRYLLLHA